MKIARHTKDRRQAADDYRLAACAPRKRNVISHLLAIAIGMLLVGSAIPAIASDVVDIALPTDNDALFRGDGPAFYQYIDRDYHGQKSNPWEGGQYGFVRDPMESSEGMVYTRFHEGIDIKPMQRDANGEPLDQIRAIADGKVVHVNPTAGYSNYGRYVVIEHHWDGSPYFSLYGHLNTIAVKVGQQVKKSEPIAVMGYTGVGINRERAHVHLELNLIVNHRFQEWYNATHPQDPNHNGIYNGINLDGLDIAKLYLALKNNPSLTIPEFLRDKEAFYKVRIPKSSHFELLKNYPWMKTGDGGRSWDVSFTRAGLPFKVEPSPEAVSQPQVVYVKKSAVDYRNWTQGNLAGRNGKAQLTLTGLNNTRLLFWPD